MTERIIMAGSGGQGMISLGKMFAEVMMNHGMEVTYFPTYGAEVRGGTAYCQVVVSTEPIYSPVVEEADTLIIMNQPSYERFCGALKPGGLMLLNSSMAKPAPDQPKDGLVCLPATELADKIGDVRTANVIMLGAYNTIKRLVPPERIFKKIAQLLTGSKAALVEVNLKAYKRGEEEAQKLLTGGAK